MRLARVKGSIVSTIKHPTYAGHKLLLVQVQGPDGEDRGPQVVAVDRVQAGVGDRVLIMTEGNGVRQVLGPNAGPIRSLVVAIVDHVELA